MPAPGTERRRRTEAFLPPKPRLSHYLQLSDVTQPVSEFLMTVCMQRGAAECLNYTRTHREEMTFDEADIIFLTLV